MNKPSEHPRRALGRGLASLIQSRTPAEKSSEFGAIMVQIRTIDPNPVQPRHVFDQESLRELADSIRSNGLIQPLIVRRKGERYELIAGERRWRAARMCNFDQIPVIVQNYSDDRMLEISLIENIQREDLNPIEVANALHHLHTQYHLNHEQIAERTGKNRATITNLLRLLKLPQEVQVLIAERRLSMGHARALVGLDDPGTILQLAEKAASQGLSVRQVERLVRGALEPREPGAIGDPQEDPNVAAAIDALQQALGTRVRIVPKSEQRGRIEIEYYSHDDLHRIYSTIVG
jgi:ParB family chromosome partitioning protein